MTLLEKIRAGRIDISAMQAILASTKYSEMCKAALLAAWEHVQTSKGMRKGVFTLLLPLNVSKQAYLAYGIARSLELRRRCLV